MEHKDVTAELKALDDKGEGVLRFIRFNQEDKDSDITLPGFIGQQQMAAYNPQQRGGLGGALGGLVGGGAAGAAIGGPLGPLLGPLGAVAGLFGLI